MKKRFFILCLAIASMGLSACGPGYYYADDGYVESWDIVTDVTYDVQPHYHDVSVTQAHGTLLFQVNVQQSSQSIETWLNLPDGRVSKPSREADPCYFSQDMTQSFGTRSEVECVDPLIGPYALTLRNRHSYPVTAHVMISRNTQAVSTGVESLYAQTFTIEPYKTFEIPLLFESN